LPKEKEGIVQVAQRKRSKCCPKRKKLADFPNKRKRSACPKKENVKVAKMKSYRFSPIRNREQLVKAVRYTALQATALCRKATGKALAIESLTIFSHYESEYKRLCGILKTMGKKCGENNGPRVALREPIKVSGNSIKYLRIRMPDPYRTQVGCNDFKVEDYDEFKRAHLLKDRKNLRLIVRPEYEMIEFFDPDFDVLAYAMSNKAAI